MYQDFMNNVDDRLDRGEVDSSDFMQIAVERYFITRPSDEDEGTPTSGGRDDGGMTPLPEDDEDDMGGGGGGGEGEMGRTTPWWKL